MLRLPSLFGIQFQSFSDKSTLSPSWMSFFIFWPVRLDTALAIFSYFTRKHNHNKKNDWNKHNCWSNVDQHAQNRGDDQSCFQRTNLGLIYFLLWDSWFYFESIPFSLCPLKLDEWTVTVNALSDCKPSTWSRYAWHHSPFQFSVCIQGRYLCH